MAREIKMCDANGNIAVYADDTTFYWKCDQTSDFKQQPELASKLESKLWGALDRGLFILMLGKLNLLHLTL